jgi:uncharacterized protein YqeY
MALLEQLTLDLETAVKSGDTMSRDTLRMVLTSVKNKSIEKMGKLTDEDVVAALQKEVKSREEAAATYDKGNRPELAEKERKEKAIIEKYLPAQMSDEELTGIIKAAITETGASGVADMGKVMAAVMPKVAGKAEGNRVSVIVRETLASGS